MPFVLSGGRLIHFAHVPKAGGTSVEAYLAARFGALHLRSARPTAGRAGAAKGSLLTSPQHLTAGDLRALLPRAPDLAFAVVRDPLARAISEFRHQHPHNPLCRLGFGLWLRVVLHAARIEPRIHDNHLRPQTAFLSEGMAVFRLEDGLDRVVAWLDRELETTDIAAMPHEQSSGKVAVRPARQDLVLIARVYADDYARCGYPPPDPARLPRDPLAWLRGLVARPLAWGVVLSNWRRWLR